MTFPYCQFAVGTEAPDAPRNPRPCRALPTFEVAETMLPDPIAVPADVMQGWFPIGDFCTGHAVTVTAARRHRAMRPLPVTVEVLGKR